MADISAPAQTETSSQKPLMLQRRFLPMWTALSLGAFTDNMLKQALSIALVYGILTAPIIGNDSAVPIIGALFPIAMLLFSTLAGQVADKYETSMMFRRTKFVEFLLMVLAAIGFLISNSAILILALFLMGAQSAFFSPVRTGAMPKYLHTNELVRGNALCSGGLFVSVMVGIVLGNILIVAEYGRYTVAAILILASLGGWLAIILAPKAPANAPDLKIDWNIFNQGVALANFAIKSPGVIRPVLGVAWYWSSGALVTVTVPFLVRETLVADPTVVAVFMALFTVGAATGAAIASMLAKGRSGLGFSGFAAVVAAIMIISVYITSYLYPRPADGEFVNAAAFFTSWQAFAIAAAFYIASVCMSIFAVPMQAAVQRRAPADKRSRILAANNMINAAGAFIGSLAVLSITETSIRPEQLILALAIIQAAIAAYMMRRKHLVEEGLYDEMLTQSAETEK